MSYQNFLPLIILLLAIWTIPWKGVALWKAARNNSKVWFVILLVVNTLALLEIIYIFIFSRPRKPNSGISADNGNEMTKPAKTAEPKIV